MTKPPRRNLPPESEPWGRHVDNRIQALQNDMDLSLTNLRAAQSANASSLVAVSKLIADVSSVVTSQQEVLTELDGVVAALPVPRVMVTSANNWQATNGGVIASITIPWEAGKSRCDVVANMNGFYQALGTVPMSDRPGFRIRIGGTQSSALPRVPDNMDTYHLVGSFARSLTSGSSFTVQVITATGASLSPAYATNRIDLNALAIFS